MNKLMNQLSESDSDRNNLTLDTRVRWRKAPLEILNMYFWKLWSGSKITPKFLACSISFTLSKQTLILVFHFLGFFWKNFSFVLQQILAMQQQFTGLTKLIVIIRTVSGGVISIKGIVNFLEPLRSKCRHTAELARREHHNLRSL